jgi:hypothetical protein
MCSFRVDKIGDAFLGRSPINGKPFANITIQPAAKNDSATNIDPDESRRVLNSEFIVSIPNSSRLCSDPTTTAASSTQ